MAELVVDLANKVTGVGVKTSYGEKIEIDGTTIVPVAIGWYGFGGGEGDVSTGTGEAGEAPGSGMGGGGGGASIPIGAYVSRDGTVGFEPNVVALAAVSIPLLWVLLRGLKGLIKVLKR
ncbi:hypothetical protein [Agromyces seonyuensis]|uniref:Sporulation protein n=1 Tax=Agromyces seonyuensis TaxID=2662446 RepID=A0A6I4P295_9MICO|nr:hypothetical protein [Agromyces seonyuensis]MWB97387.1 hypothetical protein [Agromyces seonyuensis]